MYETSKSIVYRSFIWRRDDSWSLLNFGTSERTLCVFTILFFSLIIFLFVKKTISRPDLSDKVIHKVSSVFYSAYLSLCVYPFSLYLFVLYFVYFMHGV